MSAERLAGGKGAADSDAAIVSEQLEPQRPCEKVAELDGWLHGPFAHAAAHAAWRVKQAMPSERVVRIWTADERHSRRRQSVGRANGNVARPTPVLLAA